MKISFLGTRNVDPEFGTSLGVVCEHDGRRILLDCGPYTVPGLARIGVAVDDVEAVFASHDHADHCGGLPALVMTWLLASRSRPEKLTLGVPHAKLAIRDYIRTGYPQLFSEASPRKISVERGPLTLGDVTVEWLPLDHTVETWGALVSVDGAKVLAYLPDSAPSAFGAIAERLMGVRHLVMSVWGPTERQADAAKFKFAVSTDAGRLAESVGAATLHVQHLAVPDDWHQVAEEVGKVFGGRILLPEVGEWVELA